MAITRKLASDPEEENELILDFNNGDLEVLKGAVQRLGFKDEESLLRYILAVISKSATRTFTVTGTDGKSLSLNPADALLVQKPVKEPATS